MKIAVCIETVRQWGIPTVTLRATAEAVSDDGKERATATAEAVIVEGFSRAITMQIFDALWMQVESRAGAALKAREESSRGP